MTRDLVRECDDLFDAARHEAVRDFYGDPFSHEALMYEAYGLLDTPGAIFHAGFTHGWHHLRYLLRRAALDEQVAK